MFTGPSPGQFSVASPSPGLIGAPGPGPGPGQNPTPRRPLSAALLVDVVVRASFSIPMAIIALSDDVLPCAVIIMYRYVRYTF